MVAIALRRARLADLVELTKPRIVLMVMLTAGVGFWMAGPTAARAFVLFHLLAGTMLVAAGTNALNQVAERANGRSVTWLCIGRTCHSS